MSQRQRQCSEQNSCFLTKKVFANETIGDESTLSQTNANGKDTSPVNRVSDLILPHSFKLQRMIPETGFKFEDLFNGNKSHRNQ